MWQRLREIVEEDAAAKAADSFSAAFPRFAEAWDGLKWLLARTPDLKGAARKQFEGTEYCLYAAGADPLAGTPEIWVVYSFNDNQVVIYGLHAQAPAEAPDLE